MSDELEKVSTEDCLVSFQIFLNNQINRIDKSDLPKYFKTIKKEINVISKGILQD